MKVEDGGNQGAKSSDSSVKHIAYLKLNKAVKSAGAGEFAGWLQFRGVDSSGEEFVKGGADG